MKKCLFFVVMFSFLLTGCGSSVPQAEIDRAQSALTTGLDCWKAGKKIAELKTLAEPIEFSSEEWSRGTQLVSYEIQKVEAKQAPIRFTVLLSLKDRKGTTSDKDVVFEVKLGTPIVIGRDPMY